MYVERHIVPYDTGRLAHSAHALAHMRELCIHLQEPCSNGAVQDGRGMAAHPCLYLSHACITTGDLHWHAGLAIFTRPESRCRLRKMCGLIALGSQRKETRVRALHHTCVGAWHQLAGWCVVITILDMHPNTHNPEKMCPMRPGRIIRACRGVAR